MTIDSELERLLEKLEKSDPKDPEYSTILGNVKNLYDLKSKEEVKEEIPRSWKDNIDPNTILIIVGNLLVTILVIQHEHMNVITSRASQFLKRL